MSLFASYVALGVSILIGIGGQILLKSGAMRTEDAFSQFLSPWTICGLSLYGCAAFSYILALRRIPLGIAYPTVSLSYVIVAVLGHILWQEPLGWAHLFAVLLIMSGIFVLYRA